MSNASMPDEFKFIQLPYSNISVAIFPIEAEEDLRMLLTHIDNKEDSIHLLKHLIFMAQKYSFQIYFKGDTELSELAKTFYVNVTDNTPSVDTAPYTTDRYIQKQLLPAVIKNEIKRFKSNF